jgi:hypothetical protein
LPISAFADTITTEDGQRYEGSILFHNDSVYYIDSGREVKTPISSIKRIDFDSALAQSASSR